MAELALYCLTFFIHSSLDGTRSMFLATDMLIKCEMDDLSYTVVTINYSGVQCTWSRIQKFLYLTLKAFL